MADSDNAPAGTPGVRRPDDGAAEASSPADGGSTDIPQRHHLPMRKAATLPDVSQHPGGVTGDGDGTAGPTTRTLPATEHDGDETVAKEHSGDGTVAKEHSGDGTVATAHFGDETVAEAQSGNETVARDHSNDEADRRSAVGGATVASSTSGSSTDEQSTHEPSTREPSTREPSTREPSTDTAALSVRPPEREAARRAAVRDNAATAKPAFARFLQVVVALFFPVIVVAAAMRAVATSSFLWLEYNRPGFPADRYGFSLDDRMTYGSYALDYVLNFAPARYLGDLMTPEGEPLFLESEVGHMADVKGVLGLSFFIALVLFVLAVLACVYLARRYRGGVRRALFAGAVLTLTGAVVLTVLAVLAWETFFTQVHALFFADGTWTFRVDDTLIRLFPEQFWTDSAVTIAVLVLGATIVTLIATWPTKARRERSRLAQEEAQIKYREALEAS